MRIREAFLQGLREDGYIEGHNIAIEHRYAEDSDEASKAANEFVGLRVDVIIVVGTLAALAAKRATSSIPIVGLNMADPVADGLVASLSRPGGNVTATPSSGRYLAPSDHQNRRAPLARLRTIRLYVYAAESVWVSDLRRAFPGINSETAWAIAA